jgi:L-lactate dehydrogenase complex protein LldG
MAERAEFLERIRQEVARQPGLFPAAPAPRPPDPREAAEAVRRQMRERWPEALERFGREFERVAGVFHRVRSAAQVPRIVRDIARAHDARELVAWDLGGLGVSLEAACQRDGIRLVAAPAAEPTPADRTRHLEAAARARVGVTGVDFAVAETGTLVLVSGLGRPRSTSLLPEAHVAVFGREQLLESLEQVGVMLEALHADPARSMSGAVINFITGPSRTADIELTLTRGVHGPKTVHAIFIGEP